MMDEARAALRSHADTYWSGCALAHYGEAFDPPDNAPWCLMRRDPIPASTSSVFGSAGKRVVQDPGLIIATFYVPAHSGDDIAYALAQQFGELFRTQKIGPVQTEAPTMSPADDGDNNGKWIRVAVTIPFTVSYFA